MLVIFGVLFYLSDTLEEKYHLGGIIKGFVLAIPLAALCLASFIIGKKIGRNMNLMKWIAFCGMLLVTISLFMNGFIHSLKMLIMLISIGSIGIGVALPCLDALITENIEKPQRGTITSIYSSMRFIGVAVGPPLASILVKLSPQMMFYSIGGTGIIAAILALVAIKPDSNKQTG